MNGYEKVLKISQNKPQSGDGGRGGLRIDVEAFFY
jgi:hypothetical protein